MPWLNRERMPLVVSLVLAAFCLSLYIGTIWRKWGPILRSQSLMAPKVNPPVALDFPLHWSASFLALSGEPAAVYDYNRLKTVEKDLTGFSSLPWPYPPNALLIDLPLALAPYFVSLAIWLTVTMGAYLLVLYKIAPHRLTLFWALAFFGTFANFIQGQNGFLSAALLGGGLLLLENSPLMGGMLLGLLSYKPHLAALIPLALLLGRRWQALGGTMVSGMCMILASAAVFGLDIWGIFLKNIHDTINNLHTQPLWFYKMPSIFAAARLSGLEVATAWIFHGVVMLAAVALVVWLWSGPASPAIRASALVLAILLFSPHIWYYDLTLLALPLAWLWREGRTKGWLPREQLLLLASWAIPIVSFSMAVDLKWPHGPLYLVGPLILVVQRYYWERHQPPKLRVVAPSC